MARARSRCWSKKGLSGRGDVLERRHSYLLPLLVTLSLFAIHGAMAAPIFAALATFTSKTATIIATFMSMGLAFMGMWFSSKVIKKEAAVVPTRSYEAALA
ncbi:MAG: hypothetical protein ABW034_24770 [Steroidobacteraceae bacterium]